MEGMRLKKALTLLLSLALLLGGMVTAAAADKAVKSISAKWTGGSISLGLIPRFGAHNIQVTLQYKDGSSKKLDSWSGSENGGWKVDWGSDFDWADDAREMTLFVYYSDAGSGQLSATVKVPLISMQAYLAGLDSQEIHTGESKAVTLGAYEYKLFTFTPERCRRYYIYSQGGTPEADPMVYLLNSQGEHMENNDDFRSLDYIDNNFGLLPSLEKGETYYLLVTTHTQKGGSYTLHADRRISLQNSSFERCLRYALGGWLWTRWIDYNPFVELSYHLRGLPTYIRYWWEGIL